MDEIWVSFRGPIEVSNFANFRARIVIKNKVIYRKHTPKITLKDTGYLRIGKVTIHRLIATLFIPNPMGHKEINHIDGDKLNNRADNLEWTDRFTNMRHAWYTLNRESSKPKKPVKIFKDGYFLAETRSVADAARLISGNTTGISLVCNGKKEQYKGFVFCYG